ncbi:hypothetical protein QMG90_03385 [Trabulsiella odontotermitis]|uniref:hypothetical protein n=1 Tax=Trabulsiella odontotermitis TaxID=379893 RepID=UPI0024B82188|nr:hypothetical protein [Trabulsiella odontotermitis]WHP32002.1 hypothetical protein QMG90_03385 [Trabulsiella odontotermitis]
MNVYGYASDSDDLISLNEITLQASVVELNELVDFLKNTIYLIEKHKENFEHEHFSDFLKKSSEINVEIIISNADL